MDSLLDTAGVERTFRVCSSDGKAIWGIEARTVCTGKCQYLMYLINLNSKDITVSIGGKLKIKTLKNIVSGETSDKTVLNLPVMDPMLIQIETISGTVSAQ
jgi:hypothetical protein